MDRRLELRHLPPGPLFKLVQILEASQSWKHLMSIIPKQDTPESQPKKLKYTVEHMNMIERASDSQRRPCAEILLEEWGTSGRKRPTVETLLSLLVQAELFRAAEYVAVDLLKDSLPARPETGPSASVDVSDETIEQLIPALDIKLDALIETARGEAEERLAQAEETRLVEELNRVRSVEAESAASFNTQLPHYSFSDLQRFTDNFCEIPLAVSAEKGRKLGTGAFGSVYLAIFPHHEKVAVKRLNRDTVNVEKQFRNEVEALSKFRHANLLPLLGYCCDGPSYCLVYEYMSSGSLHEMLANKSSIYRQTLSLVAQTMSRQQYDVGWKDRVSHIVEIIACAKFRATLVIPWQTRLLIALGTSRGVLHLHTAHEKPLIHRDIKTANILLDHNLVPKLGDFGLVRLGANGSRTQSIAMTTTVFGTSAYMAPEAFRGDISVKIDVFSFGVVLLELLTSLAPYDEKREGCDLVTHVEETCEDGIRPLLDVAAGDWGDSEVATQLYATALACLEEKRRRPNMADVVTRLEAITEAAGIR